MKTFHKQLIILLIFFSVLFGLLMNAAVEKLTEQSATLLIGHFKPLVNSVLNEVKFKNELTESQDIELRQLLLKESKSLENVEDLLLISTDGQIKFSFNSTLVESNYPVEHLIDRSINNSHTHFRLAKREGSGVVDAVWLIDSTNNLQGVLRINSKTGKLRSILHNMTIKYYLIGFASIVGIIFLALIGTRTLKLPLKHIERAMTVIDKRRYGF
ncbi:MAG: hypothetical protein ACE5HI_18110, partial [bacterium]